MKNVEGKRYYYIDWLKTLSMLMIVWDHLIAVRYPDMWIVENMQEWMNIPLNLIQHFGALGVSIFFIMSGFLSEHYLEKAASGKTVLNFWLKIYLSTAIANLFFLVFHKGIELVWGATWFSQYNAIDFVKFVLLIDTITASASPVNGTLWFMGTLLVYRAIVMALSHVPCQKSWYRVGILEAVLLVNTALAARFGVSSHLGTLQGRMAYIHIIMIGILIRQYCEGRTSCGKAFCLQVANAVLMLWSFRVFKIETGYLTSVAYAALIFIGFKTLNASMRKNKWIERISKASFSIYLLHATVGALLQSLFVDRLLPSSRNLAVIIALALVFVICFIYHDVIEKNYNRFFAYLNRGWNKS